MSSIWSSGLRFRKAFRQAIAATLGLLLAAPACCFSTEVSDSDEDTRKNQRGSDASPSAQPRRATPSFRFRLCLWFTPHPTPTGPCR